MWAYAEFLLSKTAVTLLVTWNLSIAATKLRIY